MNRDTAAEILGVDPDSSDEEITNRYQELVKKVHPDQGGSAELFKEVKDAKEVLIETSTDPSVNTQKKAHHQSPQSKSRKQPNRNKNNQQTRNTDSQSRAKTSEDVAKTDSNLLKISSLIVLVGISGEILFYYLLPMTYPSIKLDSGLKTAGLFSSCLIFVGYYYDISYDDAFENIYLDDEKAAWIAIALVIPLINILAGIVYLWYKPAIIRHLNPRY